MTQDLSYEEARDQLVAVVRELESGNVPLSKAMELWERGETLATVCQRWLDGAKETIRRAQVRGTEPPTSDADEAPRARAARAGRPAAPAAVERDDTDDTDDLDDLDDLDSAADASAEDEDS